MSRNKERRRHHLLRKLQRREGEGRKAYLARQSAIRFARNQIAELELKRQPIPSNADRLRHRLMFEKVSQALDLTIKKLIRTDDPYSRHPAVDAFVTVLFDLPSDCEAAVTAAGIAEEIGMPLDGDRDREVVMDWLRLPPSTLPSGLAGELLPVGRRIGGHPRLGQRPGHGAARQHRASPPQPRACRVSVNRSTGQQVNRSGSHARAERSHGMNYRSKSNKLATRRRKLSGRVYGVSRSWSRRLPGTTNKPGSRKSPPGFHEAEQFEMTDLLASVSAPGKRWGAGEGVGVKPGTSLPGNRPSGKTET